MNAKKLRKPTAGVQVHEITVAPTIRCILNVEACRFAFAQGTHHPAHGPSTSEELEEVVILAIGFGLSTDEALTDRHRRTKPIAEPPNPSRSPA